MSVCTFMCMFTCVTILTKQQMGVAGRGSGSLRPLWRCPSSRGRPAITSGPARCPLTARSRGGSAHGRPTSPPRGEAGQELLKKIVLSWFLLFRVCTLMVEGTYFKSLWIKASAKWNVVDFISMMQHECVQFEDLESNCYSTLHCHVLAKIRNYTLLWSYYFKAAPVTQLCISIEIKDHTQGWLRSWTISLGGELHGWCLMLLSDKHWTPEDLWTLSKVNSAKTLDNTTISRELSVIRTDSGVNVL